MRARRRSSEHAPGNDFSVDVNFGEVFDEESEASVESSEEVINELHFAEGGFLGECL
jgi:hypothetical protein